MLPLLTETYHAYSEDSTDSGRRAHYETAIQLLERNPILALNFVTYALRKDVSGAYAAYHIARAMPDRKYLDELTSLPWKFERVQTAEESAWHAVFGELSVPLPSAGELIDGRIYHRPSVPRLLALRDQLLREITAYEIYELMQPEEEATFDHLLSQTAPL